MSVAAHVTVLQARPDPQDLPVRGALRESPEKLVKKENGDQQDHGEQQAHPEKMVNQDHQVIGEPKASLEHQGTGEQ